MSTLRRNRKQRKAAQNKIVSLKYRSPGERYNRKKKKGGGWGGVIEYLWEVQKELIIASQEGNQLPGVFGVEETLLHITFCTLRLWNHVTFLNLSFF